MREKYRQLINNPEAISTLERDEIKSLLSEVKNTFELESRLIQIESGQAIFVGDTHGDFEASQIVITRYLKPGNTIVFLGDYLDRGPHSIENINYLLLLKLLYPQNLFLLMGNHEAHSIIGFYPANFWQQLDPGLYKSYATVLTQLPLAVVTTNGIVALHGALPDIENLQDINEIDIGSEVWRQITWGDWQERRGSFLGDDVMTGRPQFGIDHFNEVMARFQQNILIRSHQPNVPQIIFNGRCLTIFTSRACVARRTIAIVDLNKKARTTETVDIEVI